MRNWFFVLFALSLYVAFMISPGDQRGGNFYVTVALGDDGWTKFSSFNMTAQADMFLFLFALTFGTAPSLLLLGLLCKTFGSANLAGCFVLRILVSEHSLYIIQKLLYRRSPNQQ